MRVLAASSCVFVLLAACGSSSTKSATPTDGGAPTRDATANDGASTADGAVTPNDASRSVIDADAPEDGATPLDAATLADAALVIDASAGATCNGSVLTHVATTTTEPTAPAITVPSGFALEAIASISGARELVALPNGDLLVGTNGTAVHIVPNAEADGAPGVTSTFVTLPESPAEGLAFDAPSCSVYVSTQHGVYSMKYADAQLTAQSGTAIADVRTGSVAPNSDGDIHTSTSVAVANEVLYASVGSSCNACTETDPTRASVQRMNLDGTNMTTKATRIRNAIAITANPMTGTLWGGGAGQDNLAENHPYEYFDAITSHAGLADYGWPECEEDNVPYASSVDCSETVVPRIELPAYSTIIGAAFYPTSITGANAFPSAYHGGVFISAHGSWHKKSDNTYVSAPRVVFVAMNGDSPAKAVNWDDPTVQWTEFIGGFQLANGTTRIGRPTGVAVGSRGSLFVADDQTGMVYRVRPKG